MIKKQNLWFTFLCSIILVLSIIYVSMNSSDFKNFKIDDFENLDIDINESTELVALRVQDDEGVMDTINELQNIILDNNKSVSDKSNAYDSLKSLSSNKSLENKIETLIKKEYDLESFTKVNGDNISIFINTSKHDYSLANEIIRKVENIIHNKYITVKFN